MNITLSTIAKINAVIAQHTEKLVNEVPLAAYEKEDLKELFDMSKEVTSFLSAKKALSKRIGQLQ